MFISISDKCNACGVCSAINSDIFEIGEGFATVNQERIDGREDDCIDAAFACPLSAIKIDEF